MEIITRKWLERAKYDLETAEAMFSSRRYLYVAFLCQQALEKALKAVIAQKGGEVLRTHNLVRLAELTGFYIEMTVAEQNFLADLTPFAIEARYGDYKNKLSEIINRKLANSYLNKTKDLFLWLKKQIKK